MITIERLNIEEQKEKEFKVTILVLICVFLAVGVGLGGLFQEFIITWTSGLTCVIIGIYKWIQTEYY